VKQRIGALLELAVLVGALATIPLTILQEQGAKSITLDAIDWAIWVTFAIEFMFVVSTARRVQIVNLTTAGRLAVVVLSLPVLPNLLALVRLARLVRLLRLLRLTGVTALGVSALKVILGRRGLVHISAVTALLILGGGGALSILEPQTVKGGFGDGIWWAVVTASTVGYGDISPSTVWGRIIAVLLMLVGIGLMSTLAASITTYFVHQTENSELKEVAARLGRIERILLEQRNSEDEPEVAATRPVGRDES
jgi:voltage-gated potassium channel